VRVPGTQRCTYPALDDRKVAAAAEGLAPKQNGPPRYAEGRCISYDEDRAGYALIASPSTNSGSGFTEILRRFLFLCSNWTTPSMSE